MNKVKKAAKNVQDSSVYKTIVKPALNIVTGGFYDMIDQSANIILKDRKDGLIDFVTRIEDLLKENDIQNNPHVISGLIELYNFVMKQRFSKKVERGYGIYLGFLGTKDKEMLELERMYNTLNLISLKGLVFLIGTDESKFYHNLQKQRLDSDKQILVYGMPPLITNASPPVLFCTNGGV